MDGVLDLIDPCQRGFLAGLSGSDHTLAINSFFYEGVEDGSLRHLFLMDTAKAFDSIDHEWIKVVLKKLGFPRWFLSFMNASLSRVKVSPFFGTSLSHWIDIERGVKQGCPLSPLIFILA